jgi:hypothetical protein
MTEIVAELGNARNTLLCAPSMSGDERGACTELLLHADPADTSVLWVAYSRDPNACLAQWEDETDQHPRNAAVVTVGDTVGESTVPFGTVESITSPSDLTGLGIQIGQFLSEWDGELVVCFDSLTALLQYVDLQTAYEFLHAITGQLHAAGAYAHFHVDPTAHDQQTIDSIASLFDAVVTLGEGDPAVRTRKLME